jgi:hydroxymethylpyrimidine pyrophosphatase-like HAD family hydrolase
MCGFSVAVSNALDSVKQAANWTSVGPRGRGVTEVLNELLSVEARA